MLALVALLAGFAFAAVVLAGLTLYLNEFEKKVSAFCDVVRDRYRPTFHQELESKAAAQIEAIAKAMMKKP